MPNQENPQEMSLDISQKLQAAIGLHQGGKLKEANEAYLEILAVKSDHFDATQLLAASLAQAKQFSEAIPYFESAITLNPDNAAVLNNYGHCLHALNRYESALEKYHEAIICNPQYHEAHINYANTLKKLKRNVEAELAFRGSS